MHQFTLNQVWVSTLMKLVFSFNLSLCSESRWLCSPSWWCRVLHQQPWQLGTLEYKSFWECAAPSPAPRQTTDASLAPDETWRRGLTSYEIDQKSTTLFLSSFNVYLRGNRILRTTGGTNIRRVFTFFFFEWNNGGMMDLYWLWHRLNE